MMAERSAEGSATWLADLLPAERPPCDLCGARLCVAHPRELVTWNDRRLRVCGACVGSMRLLVARLDEEVAHTRRMHKQRRFAGCAT